MISNEIFQTSNKNFFTDQLTGTPFLLAECATTRILKGRIYVIH